MKQNFMNTVKVDTPSTNFFDLTHDHKLSCNMGRLVPTMLLECIPGDNHRISFESLLRFAPLLAPVMHRISVYFHAFFVPNRILWPNWEKWISPQETGQAPISFPTLSFGGMAPSIESGSLADYLGLPLTDGNVDQDTQATVNAFPFAAYQKVYDDYYRDQNLIDPVPFELVDGTNFINQTELTTLRIRAWEHDLFTASLPFAQKGTPVDIPFSFNEDVAVYRDRTGDGPSVIDLTSGLPDPLNIGHVSALDPDGQITADSLYAKTSQLEGGSSNINDLRMAIRLQEFLEQDARGGTRYIESIFVHFGVKSSDARLQRAEYITGSKQDVSISEVLNTTGTADAPQGDMAGHGIAYTEAAQGESYFCQEHGWIICLMSIMPKTAYQQGIQKHWLRFNDRYEFFWPKMANLGEEAVQNQEVYAYTSDYNQTFGYMPRYYDYRYQPNRVSGDFQTSLAFWHEGRIFDAAPTLSQEFIECIPANRIFAVQDDAVQKLWVQVLNHVKSERKIPFFGTPTL